MVFMNFVVFGIYQVFILDTKKPLPLIVSIPIEKRCIPKISRPRLNKRSMSASDEGICQDPGPDKLYSTLRRMTSRSFICAFWAVAWW